MFRGHPPPAPNFAACTAAPFFRSFFDMVLVPSFLLILVPTWLQLASQLRSKIDQKSIQEASKIYSNLYLVLSTFLNRFLIDFGSNLGTSNPPFTCKKTMVFEDFYDFACLPFGWLLKPTWLHFGRFLGAKLAPSWHQIAPKIDPKNKLKKYHILDQLSTDF